MIKLKCMSMDCKNEGIIASTEFRLLEGEFKVSIEDNIVKFKCSRCGKVTEKEILKESD